MLGVDHQQPAGWAVLRKAGDDDPLGEEPAQLLRDVALDSRRHRRAVGEAKNDVCSGN